MRRINLCLLAIALLGGITVARADDPAPVSVRAGIVVTSTATGGEFNSHQLVVSGRSLDKPKTERILAELSTLGLKGHTTNNTYELLAPLPDGKCDGSRIGDHPRAKVVEALMKLPGVEYLTLRSYPSGVGATESGEKKALSAALKAAYEKASAMARSGGGRLGKLLGVESSIESSGEARNLSLKPDGVEVQTEGGETAKVIAHYALR